MKYFVMASGGIFPSVPIRKSPDLGPAWYTGTTKKNREIPNPVVYTCVKDREKVGTLKHLYNELSVPIMSAELRETLTEAGVDNIEYFPALVRDPKARKKYPNYFAFNVIGAVAAADMSKSKMMGTSDSVMIDADFDSLVIDPEAARGMLLFRLAQNLSAIIVHERVKNAVEKRAIPGVLFYEPEEWAG